MGIIYVFAGLVVASRDHAFPLSQDLAGRPADARIPG